MSDSSGESSEGCDCSSSSSVDSREPDEAVVSGVSGGYVAAGRLIPCSRPHVRHPQAADAMTSTVLPGGEEVTILVNARRTIAMPDRIFVWRLEPEVAGQSPSFKLVTMVDAPVAPQICVTRSPDGRHLVTGGTDGMIVLWLLDAASPLCAVRPMDVQAAMARTGQSPELRARCMGYIIAGELGRNATMINSVRFVEMAGRTRLVVACQNGWVYFLNLASDISKSVDHKADAKSFNTNVAGMKPCLINVWLGPFDIPRDGWDSFQSTTLAAGQFEAAVNYALPSPDGNWLAVVGDMSYVACLSRASGFSAQDPGHVLKLDLCGTPQRTPCPGEREWRATNPGSACGQYLAWSSDSRYLAASSDSNNSVTVWDMIAEQRPGNDDTARGTPVLALEGFRRPVLAVTFITATVLAFAEDHGRITIVDVVEGPRSQQQLSGCEDQQGARFRFGRIAALHLSRSGSLLALVERRREFWPFRCHRNGLHKMPRKASLWDRRDEGPEAAVVLWQPLYSWSERLHAHFPRRFREAARTLVEGCSRKERPGAPKSLSSIPRDLVPEIVSTAAYPIGKWMEDARRSRKRDLEALSRK